MITTELYLIVAARLSIGILRVSIYYNKNDHILLKEQKPILTGIDGTVNYVYIEVLELHKKVNGLFKILRPHTRMFIPILFPDAGRITIEQLQYFHDHLILILITISCGILGTIYIIICSSYRNRDLTESQTVEMIWTVVPLFIIIAIGLPSLNLLYLVDDSSTGCTTSKAIGHQWYWEYDYPDCPSIDSYMNISDLRLLNTDNRLICTTNLSIQILISAADVLHSWTIPSLAVKADAVPGRVNKLILTPKRPGIYFGQCSEICGSNHRFMPISIESY